MRAEIYEGATETVGGLRVANALKLESMIMEGEVDEAGLSKWIAKRTRTPWVYPGEFDPSAASALPEYLARANRVVPIGWRDGVLQLVAMSPYGVTDTKIDALVRHKEVLVAPMTRVHRLLARQYGPAPGLDTPCGESIAEAEALWGVDTLDLVHSVLVGRTPIYGWSLRRFGSLGVVFVTTTGPHMRPYVPYPMTVDAVGRPIALGLDLPAVLKLLKAGRAPLEPESLLDAVRSVSGLSCVLGDPGTTNDLLFEWLPPNFEGRRLRFDYWNNVDATAYRIQVDEQYDVDVRPLGQHGHQQMYLGRPYVDAGGRWCAPESKTTGNAAADYWRECASYEYASVASFSRAALELMQYAAPPALVRRLHESALDEVRHAELCYGLAESFDGAKAKPGPLPVLPPREGTLADLAVDAFREGVVAESVAVEEARVARTFVRDPEVRAVLEVIERDEARHRDLARDIIAWAATQDSSVLLLVAAEARSLLTNTPPPTANHSQRPNAFEHGELEPHTRTFVQRSVMRAVAKRYAALDEGALIGAMPVAVASGAG